MNQDQAFPTTQINVCDGQVNSCVVYPGLTKREYFAAIAMAGIFANSKVECSEQTAAESAVFAADALIAELNK